MTDYRCKVCHHAMEVCYIFDNTIGMMYFLRCSSRLCRASGPVSLTEIGAAAGWLKLTDTTRPGYDCSDEPTVHLLRKPTPQRTRHPDLPSLPPSTGDKTCPLRPLPSLGCLNPREDVG